MSLGFNIICLTIRKWGYENKVFMRKIIIMLREKDTKANHMLEWSKNIVKYY